MWHSNYLLPTRTQAAQLRWKLHRSRLQRSTPEPFGKSARRRWLFISQQDPICTTQIFPFFFYSKMLREAYGIEAREISLEQFAALRPYRDQVDAVCFQTWFDWTDERMIEFVKSLGESYPKARLAFLDWFAPVDLRYAKVLEGRIAVYLKKHLFRNRNEYEKTTLGDTNLTDYYGRRLGLALEPVRPSIPGSFWKKLVVGTNFSISAHMLPKFAGRFPERRREIDVHARLGLKGTPWYEGMRAEASKKVSGLRGVKVVSAGSISRKQYYQELFESKMCFSPFGYGEVCWRDYEAAFAGSLLLKPDMSHVETHPDIFKAYETYVPVRWDLRDLEEKIRYYLAHAAERDAIAQRAFTVIHDYIRKDHFSGQLDEMVNRLN